ncbi:MAG: hypothetical protein ACLVJ6_09090 [Merdibacter sp.]
MPQKFAEPVTLIDGKATAVITVIAEDGSEQVYRIYFVSETEVPQEPVDPAARRRTELATGNTEAGYGNG